MKNNITILHAMQDEQLFGPTFRPRIQGDSWLSWRCFLQALFGLPMDEEALEIFRRHTGRQNAPAQQFNECFCICGRRSGKTQIASMIATYLAAFRDYSGILGLGEWGTIPVICADRRQGRTVLSYVNAFFESPMLAPMVVARLKESIELSNRIRIEIHTSSFRSIRGYTVVAAVCDEVAFWPADENSASPDREILAALRPAMATVPGALLLGISSPYAKRGELWRSYREHYGRDDSNVLIWRTDSCSMNPMLSREVVAAAYARDAASAKAEFGGEFRSDVEGFLGQEAVEAVVVPHRFELPYNSERTYVGFVDPSGGVNDAMTLGIAHGEAEKTVLDMVRESVPPFSPERVVAEFARLLKAYHIHEVTGDAYSGDWVREQFQKCGVSYRVSEMNRSEIYLEFLAATMSGRVELLDNKKLVSQITSLERRTGRSGRDSIDHSPGTHDDVANAAAGALVHALGSSVCYGLLNYFQGIQRGEIPLPEEQLEVRQTIRENIAQWKRRRLEFYPAALEKFSAEPQPCEKCGSNLMQRLGGATRCAQCGHQIFGGFSIVAGRGRDGRPVLRKVKWST